MKPQHEDSSSGLRSSGPLSAIRTLALLTGLLLAQGAFAASSLGTGEALQYIQRIDMVSLSHLDVGFTDQPSTVHEFQRRYLDVAIDLCWGTRDRVPEERFHWTAESAMPVSEWWQSAPPDRRERLVELIKRGQIDIGGFPFNINRIRTGWSGSKWCIGCPRTPRLNYGPRSGSRMMSTAWPERERCNCWITEFIASSWD
jgi:hypothetical protein